MFYEWKVFVAEPHTHTHTSIQVLEMICLKDVSKVSLKFMMEIKRDKYNIKHKY